MTPIVRLSTFSHPVLGWFTINRRAAREMNADQIIAAALLLQQIGH